MHQSRTLHPPVARVLISFILPLAGAIVLHGLVSITLRAPADILPDERGGAALLFAGAGAVSLVLGLRWYGLSALGLRGGRPLYASIGFAALGWVVTIIARVFVVGSEQELVVSPTFARDFIYLVLFEAFALQLWTFGLLFHSIADWRGPLTAAVGGGLAFGVAGFLLFEEAYITDLNSLLFFVAWGLFYGLIRLRTGSILGMVVVQAMQSLTTWHILLPEAVPHPSELHLLYAITATFYVIFIWRLWPKEETDYRV
ncbi:MAG TPA: hypothetical protein VE553_03785 [Candidatus Binatia bacterium]|nr:hypothetical protein [Candidatus Binatia bacterium]